MVISPGQGSLGTQSNASLEEMNKTRGNFCRGAEEEGAIRGNMAAGTSPLGKLQQEKSRMIQARKTLKLRDKVLTAAIRRCHIELAERTSFGKIEASKDAVEAAWNEFNHATARYCMHAGGDLSRKELDEQPEEARRAWYEWKALSNMMDEVVDKAEEYLEESATRENYYDDRDDGGKLDAKVEQLSTMDEVNVDEVNMDEVNMDEVNMDEVNVDEVNVNEVNEESAMIEDSGEVCGVKEEMSKGKSLEIEAKVEVKEESEEVVTAKPPDVLLRFDSTAKVQVEEFGMKEVMQIDYLKMKKESRHASWDPGEPVNAKAQTEMLDAKEEKILVNNGKVGLRGDVNWMVFYAAMELNIIVISNFKEMLVAFSLSRFVNGFRLDCRIELSDYG